VVGPRHDDVMSEHGEEGITMMMTWLYLWVVIGKQTDKHIHRK
jgi:hypothetical protein